MVIQPCQEDGKICSNPKLGYRTSGSGAELKTGDMLAETMRKLGFPKVYKDAIKVDAWEFNKAELTFEDRHGKIRKVQLGAYQTHFVTEGGQNFTLAYVGKGTRQDYEGIDVKGKLVLVDINQRDEWWINFPVYQAHLNGAAAVIAVQTGGYGEVDDAALNAQDIAGPADAPAFSISRKDAEHIKHALGENKEITVTLDAVSKVERTGQPIILWAKFPENIRSGGLCFPPITTPILTDFRMITQP